MFNKIYEFLKRILKENYKIIIFLICFTIVISYPVPYYIFTSGGIDDLSSRFEIEDGFKQEGSYNLSYVSELEGNVLTYLTSFIIPDWDLVKVSNYQVNEDESIEELAIRDRLSLYMANEVAIREAYEKAEKEFNILSTNFYVIYTDENIESSEKIKVGDIIDKIDGKKITDIEEISSFIDNKNVGDYLNITLKRGEKEIETSVKVREVDGMKETGIAVYLLHDYETNPKIKIKFSSNESGASAGLMTTLAIYDTLIEEDLTHGLKIAGTGTIENDGSVGEIGGVSYKLKGAVASGADLFLVPKGENYDECMKLKKERNYDITIVAISNLDEAINYLRSLK